MKKCPECGLEKENTEFYKKLKGLSYRCKTCTKKIHTTPENMEKRRVRENKWRKENLDLAHKRWKIGYIKNYKRFIVYAAKKRALESGIEFNLNEGQIKIPELCPVLGFKLQIGHENRDYWPTIDRIDNSKGYTVDNIVIVSYRVNRIKSDATLEELRLLAENCGQILRERGIVEKPIEYQDNVV